MKNLTEFADGMDNSNIITDNSLNISSILGWTKDLQLKLNIAQSAYYSVQPVITAEQNQLT